MCIVQYNLEQSRAPCLTGQTHSRGPSRPISSWGFDLVHCYRKGLGKAMVDRYWSHFVLFAITGAFALLKLQFLLVN